MFERRHEKSGLTLEEGARGAILREIRVDSHDDGVSVRKGLDARMLKHGRGHGGGGGNCGVEAGFVSRRESGARGTEDELCKLSRVTRNNSKVSPVTQGRGERGDRCVQGMVGVVLGAEALSAMERAGLQEVVDGERRGGGFGRGCGDHGSHGSHGCRGALVLDRIAGAEGARGVELRQEVDVPGAREGGGVQE